MSQNPPPLPFHSLLYRPLQSLQYRCPYQIMGMHKRDGGLILHLRGVTRVDSSEFKTRFVMTPASHKALVDAASENTQMNGPGSPLFITHTGRTFVKYPCLEAGGYGQNKHLWPPPPEYYDDTDSE